MRKVNTGINNYTEVYAIDEQAFNANHEYEVRKIPAKGTTISKDEIYAKVLFQRGPIKENGVNGCCNEDLIAIVLDRLYSLNQGDFKCRENSIAITQLAGAMMWLKKRTADIKARGVEGTSQK